MDNNTDIQDIIDHYLSGEMNADEIAAFEKEIAADPTLREEVELTRHILSAIDDINEQDILEAIKSMPEDKIRQLIAQDSPLRESEVDFEATPEPEGSKPPTRKRPLLIFMAAAAAIILVLLYIGSRPLLYSPAELYTQYYQVQPYETYPVRGDTELTQDEIELIQQARAHYEKAEYPEALKIYERFFTDKQDWRKAPDEMIFYSAISRFETGNQAGALEQLEYIAFETASDYQDDALWNLAFAYLKDDQRNKAEDCLNRLIENKSDYTAQAKELLDKLKTKKWF